MMPTRLPATVYAAVQSGEFATGVGSDTVGEIR